MSRNTDVYPEPEEFRPERHLSTVTAPGSEKAAGAGAQVDLPSSFTFGFGRRYVSLAPLLALLKLILHPPRRICPGQAFADRAIWLAIAHIVAAFDVCRTVDASGNEIVPPAAFKPAMTV